MDDNVVDLIEQKIINLSDVVFCPYCKAEYPYAKLNEANNLLVCSECGRQFQCMKTTSINYECRELNCLMTHSDTIHDLIEIIKNNKNKIDDLKDEISSSYSKDMIKTQNEDRKVREGVF